MAAPTADELFVRIPEYSVMVCRQCQYAVRPTQVVFHLTHSPHRIPGPHARQIQAVVDAWDPVERDPSQLVFPVVISRPIEGLAVYRDGILCTQTPDCGYVCRSREGIRKHWRTQHSWSPYRQRGRHRAHETEDAQTAIQNAMQRVTCQRFFPTRVGSHYIRVTHPPSPQQPHPAREVHDARAVDRLIEEVRGYERQDREAQRSVVQAGDLDEATPWLNRTGWIRYLQGVPRRELFHSTARPEEETAEGSERAAGTIWQAVHRLATVSQDVAKACGHLLRIEISRTAKHESPHSPLLAYLNPADIQKHVAPWQKIMMFFARTQVGNIISINLHFPGHSPGW